MNLSGVEFAPAPCPLDSGFLPLSRFNRAFLRGADRPVSVAVERENGTVSVFDSRLRGGDENRDANLCYLRRLVKCLLWIRGGFRVTVCGDDELAGALKRDYSPDGERAFDAEFMAGVYGHPFEVRALPMSARPRPNESNRRAGGHKDGCRIGLDVGGSNLKYAVVRDGMIVFTGEFPWQPLGHSDPAYHEAQIVEALRRAAGHLPRVDAVGISSAGIFINGRARVASIFRSIPEERFERDVSGIYQRAVRRALGGVPVVVANDGDVTALAGSESLSAGCVLGISMGTSQAGGYVDRDGNLPGWLSELAFVPVDLQPSAAVDPWSGDAGCGVEYLAQGAALRLAEKANLPLPADSAPSERVRSIQALAEGEVPGARQVFETIGCYLGYALPLYAEFYDLRRVLLYGGLTRGAGGADILRSARAALQSEDPALARKVEIQLPPDNDRRAGQSLAAATL